MNGATTYEEAKEIFVDEVRQIAATLLRRFTNASIEEFINERPEEVPQFLLVLIENKEVQNLIKKHRELADEMRLRYRLTKDSTISKN